LRLDPQFRLQGTQFTFITGTIVQILTQKALPQIDMGQGSGPDNETLFLIDHNVGGILTGHVPSHCRIAPQVCFFFFKVASFFLYLFIRSTCVPNSWALTRVPL
jgi:hypothetical protein